MMSEEKLRTIIRSELEDRSRVDCKIHEEHHQFIAEYIEAQQMKRERWEAIKRQVLGWGIIAIVGTLGTMIGRKFGVNL